MAQDTPFGLQVAQTLDAQYGGGNVIRCAIPASDGTAVGIGCPVKAFGQSDADGNPQVIRATAGDQIYGIVVGFEEDPNYLEDTHRTASTLRYAFVNINPDTIYVAQEDDDTSSIVAANIGQNFDLVFGSVNTTTGMSGVEIDSDSAAATGQVKLIGIAKGYDEDMSIGGGNCKWLVKINEHHFAGGTGSTGA